MENWPYLFVGVGMVLWGAWPLRRLLRDHRLIQRTHSWPTVVGSVTRSQIDNDDNTFRVGYRYEVDGVRHHSSLLQVDTDESTDRVQELLDDYPVGADVDVYYDPAEPAMGVLKPGGRSDVFVQMLGKFATICLGMVLVGVSAWPMLQEKSGEPAVEKAPASLPQVPYYPLNDPRGVAVAADGTVYVCDGPKNSPVGSGPSITVRPPNIPGLPTTRPIPLVPARPAPKLGDGSLLRLGSDLANYTDLLPGQLAGPEGVAVDGSGRLYVTDGGRLSVYTREQREKGVPGTMRLGGLSVTALAVDLAGTIYVTEASSGRLLRQPADATTATEIFKLPSSGAVGDIAVDGAGNVYLTDKFTNRVFKIAPGGASSELPFPYLSQPKGVALDSAGGVYVVDAVNHRVMRLSAGSQSATDLLLDGLVDPYDVAVDNAGDIYVTDRGGHWVLKFPPHPSS